MTAWRQRFAIQNIPGFAEKLSFRAADGDELAVIRRHVRTSGFEVIIGGQTAATIISMACCDSGTRSIFPVAS